MTLDWGNATPLASLLGGMLIGLAAAVLIVANGKVAGISGILAGLLRRLGQHNAWRIAFLAGLLLAPVIYAVYWGLPEIVVTTDWALLIGGGLLVGFGTRLGNGCTSGHGVCGIARLSPRSIVATLVFMSVAMLTVFVRHWI
ncbi:YeeE/YedE family protein [Methylobacillus arboreus]|uniref:YeeE/YedE family protein n=1 Tax=Methylobacillus arboreus TaxID=755170 RepID=UPI001E52CB0F|nr:YeeE/YedE thiosulfate transporter family protein [Methylobacillus arboreus]MCB5189457.1 YeeE/YedE family protein [Methylobacillus arboreus]